MDVVYLYAGSQMPRHLISDCMGGVDQWFFDIGSQMEDDHRMSHVGT